MTARLAPERRRQIVARLVRHGGRDLSRYIASQEDVAALLAELDAVRAERDALREAAEYAVDAWDDGDMHRKAIEQLRAALGGKGEG